MILDAGCGDGTFANYLACSPGRRIIGLDVDARPLPSTPTPATFGLGSLAALPLRSDRLDAAVVVLALHHLDGERALAELTRVLRPGGRLVVLGLARLGGPSDLPAELRDALAHRVSRIGKRQWEPRTVKSEPELTWAETRALFRRTLPGATYRRLPMWRYLVIWDK